MKKHQTSEMPARTLRDRGSDVGDDQAVRYLYLPAGSRYSLESEPSAISCVPSGLSSATAGAELQGRPGGSSIEVATAGPFFLPDGSHVDLIRDPTSPNQLCFLIWNPQGVRLANHIKAGGQVFVPPQLHPTLVGAVRLPSGIQPCGEIRDMLEQISEIIFVYVDLPEDSLFLASAFVVSGWFPELLVVAPYIWVAGAFGTGKTTVLKLFHCLCRRAILVSDVTPAALYLLPSLLKPTLLIDEGEFGNAKTSRELHRLLRAGNTAGTPAVRGGVLYDLFCPKVVASRQPPPDAALGSRAILLPMLPTQRDLPALDAQAMQKIAESFQPRLLDLRHKYYEQLRSAAPLNLERLSPRTRDIGRALGTVLLNAADLQQRLGEILEEQDAEVRLERTLEPEWAVATALFHKVHEKPVGELFVGEIADRANRILAAQGETRKLTERAVGEVLKIMGLKTRKLAGWGRGFHVALLFRRKVHQIARIFGITRYDIANWMAAKAGNAGPPCVLCTEFDLLGGLRFTQLKRGGRTGASRFGLGPREHNGAADEASTNDDSNPSPGSSDS